MFASRSTLLVSWMSAWVLMEGLFLLSWWSSRRCVCMRASWVIGCWCSRMSWVMSFWLSWVWSYSVNVSLRVLFIVWCRSAACVLLYLSAAL